MSQDGIKMLLDLSNVKSVILGGVSLKQANNGARSVIKGSTKIKMDRNRARTAKLASMAMKLESTHASCVQAVGSDLQKTQTVYSQTAYSVYSAKKERLHTTTQNQQVAPPVVSESTVYLTAHALNAL